MVEVITRVSMDVTYTVDEKTHGASSREDWQFLKCFENALAKFKGKDGVTLTSFGNPTRKILKFTPKS